MDDIRNKADYLAKHGMAYDVKKPKDVLGKDTVQVRDVMNSKDKDAKIDKMSDVFPQSNQQNKDLLS